MAKSKKTGVCEEILCAGFGGQGIMFMGKLLAQAGLEAGKFVTWMPSYGAEVRGGTAYSMAKISNHEIASPIVTNPDILIVMNAPSLIKYESKLKVGGTLIANKSLIGDVVKRKGIRTINIRMTELAFTLGDVRCANMIALGAMLKISRMLALKNVVNAARRAAKGKTDSPSLKLRRNLAEASAKADIFLRNRKALEKGYRITG